jgi:hypothetical protein
LGHALVFIYLVTLLVGLWAAFSTWQSYDRRRISFLRHLLHHIVFINAAVFLYLVAKYVITNLLGNGAVAPHPLWVVSACVVGFCVGLGLAITLVQLVYALLGRVVPASVNRVVGS